MLCVQDHFEVQYTAPRFHMAPANQGFWKEYLGYIIVSPNGCVSYSQGCDECAPSIVEQTLSL